MDFVDTVPVKNKLKKKDIHGKGRYPVYSSDSEHNGIIGYTQYPEFISVNKSRPNFILFGDHTKTMIIPNSSFSVADNVKVLKLKDKYHLNTKLLLFIFSMWRKTLPNLGYARHWKFAQNSLIQLPIKNNAIDFNFMESFIAELEAQRIAELEAQRIAELHAYLKVTGLSSYTLTLKEKNAIDKLKNKNLYFKPFKLASTYIMRKNTIHVSNEGLFNISPTKKKINANNISFNGDFNYVARGETNNGIRGKITFDTEYLNEENTISFGQDTATMFYQKDKYFTGDKIQILSLNKKYGLLNHKKALFLISAMDKSFSLYSWGANSFSLEAISNEDILLPVNDNNEIDFEYMETFISAIQKLVIKDVVLYTNKKIKTTKQVLNKDDMN